MDTDLLEKYKSKLMMLRGEYKQTLSSVKENNSLGLSQREEYQELSYYDNHPADIGTEDFMREMSYAKLDYIKNTISQINEALKKIDNNTFGICENCGKNIEKERLDALPYSPYCIKCENEKEKPGMRPIDYRLSKEINLRDERLADENVEFDGEDMNQQLGRFNRTKDPSLQTGDQFGIEDELQSGLVEPIDNISDDYYRRLMENNKKKNTKNVD